MTIPDIRNFYRYVASVLPADTELNAMGFTAIYSMTAPETAELPYLVMNRQSGVHENTLGEGITYGRHYILIKAVTEGTDGGLLARQANHRVIEVINGQHPTGVLSIHPKTDVEYIEAHQGNLQFMHVGTVFEVYVGN